MIGKTISHYKILEKLGAGGMGVVYKAEDTKLKRLVAIKVLPSTLTHNPEIKDRFIHEAQTASALDHPNICTIHEINESDDGQLYIVMACYEGESLKNKIEEKSLGFEDSINIIFQIMKGISKAHEKGIVHRDIKPDNIMITTDGIVKIVDFGLAKLSGQSRLTRSGVSLGTVAYMSPEQARGEEVDPRTDIYSLGVVFYEMLTGELPFKGFHELAMMYSIVNEDPQPPSELNPDISPEMEVIILKAMAKDQEERYQNVIEMGKELNSIAEKTGKVSFVEIEKIEDKDKLKFTKGISQIPLNKIYKYFIPVFAIIAMLFVLFFVIDFIKKNSTRIKAKEHVDLANLYLETGKLDSAKIELEWALEYDSTYAMAWSSLAAVSRILDDLNLAIFQTIKAIEYDPKNFRAAYNLAFALEDKNRLEESLEWYEKAVQINPTFTPGYSALGNINIKLNKPAKAIVVLNKAIKKAPDPNFTYLIYKNLGKAYKILGNYNEAIKNLDKSRKLEQNQIETILCLAEVYETVGRIKESITCWQLYINQETDSLKVKEARAHLQKLQK